MAKIFDPDVLIGGDSVVSGVLNALLDKASEQDALEMATEGLKVVAGVIMWN